MCYRTNSSWTHYLSMASETPQKLPLTDKLLSILSFENRVLGLNENGSLKTTPTPPGMTDWFLRDSSMPGFSVRVTRKGLRFYAERKLAGRPCRFDCGEWPQTSLSKARKTAETALSKIKLGQDPNTERKKAIASVIDARERARLTFGFAMGRDAANHEKTDAKGTAKDRRDVRKWIEGMEIWRMPLHDVSKESLQKMMQEVSAGRGAPSSVKVWRYARAAWNRLPASETPPVDPFAEWLKAHTLPVIKRRQTTISTDETQGREWLKAIAALRKIEGSRAFAHRVMADYIILTLCWGARRSEAAALKIEDIDFEREYVVFRDTKNGKDHYFPLTPGCASILHSRIADNQAPRGVDVKKAKKGEEYYIPEWAFPSRIRGKHLAEPAGALAVGEGASGLEIDMHDLRRSFAGEVAADVMVGADGKATGNFGLVKVAMNHSDMQNDVTQGYIMIKSRLKMLRPIYLAHERRVFNAAGLNGLLPHEEIKSDDETLLAAFLRMAKDNPSLLKRLNDQLSS